MLITKAAAGWLRIIGVILIFVAVRIAFPALTLSSKKLTADSGDTTHAWMSPGQTLAVAGFCLVVAMTCIIIGSLSDNESDI